MSLLDPDRLQEGFARSRWWSVERWNLVSFRRRDYLAPHDLPLADAVRERVAAATGEHPAGPVLMLGHLRQWGQCFNPVTFYFCLRESSDGHCAQPEFIVAEVENTPWRERHAYVLDMRGQHGPDYRASTAKELHVSPFLPMGLDYHWRFRLMPDAIDVHMRVTDNGADCFAAGMRLALQPMEAEAMRRMPLGYPFMALRVLGGIYGQAARLWLKRIPFLEHPRRRERSHG